MTRKTLRQHLNEYTAAASNMEIAEAAITMLERCRHPEAQTAIRALKRGQNRQLRLLDASAARLGAPYPHPERMT